MAKNKQGESKKLKTEEQDFKVSETIKKGATSLITMRDGKPQNIYFKDGKEVGAEPCRTK